MKKVFYVAILLAYYPVIAQLYVSTNSYVFVKDQYVFVNQDTNLQSNGNIFLRNEAQFLQGTSVASTNKGTGALSVFQEGTANNYGYNYWCSPVGLTTTLTGNGQFSLNPIINRPATVTSSVLPSYTGSYNGVAGTGSLSIATYWIYKFAVSDNYSQWGQIGEAGTIDDGLGFTMKGVSGDDLNASVGEASFNNPSSSDSQRYDFRGRPNDGLIDIPVLAPTTGTQYPNSTLTGNPYPSPINLNLFLLENSGYSVNYTTGVVSPTPNPFPAAVSGPINGIAYFWEHEKPATTHILVGYIGGYGYYVPNNPSAFGPGVYNNATWNTYNLDGSLNVTGGGVGTERYKRMFTPIGQGFMVQGLDGGSAYMKNIYRVYRKENVSDSQFERNPSIQPEDFNGGNWEAIPNVAGVDYTQFSKAEVPQIKIFTVLNNQFTREVTLAFNPNTSDGFDTAMDAISQEATLTNDAYFSIVANPNPFVVTTLPFDINKRVPFTLKAGAGTATYKISVGNIINFNGSDNVYLYDGATGVYHDIKDGVFEITLPEGIHENRFEITFKDDALGNGTNIKLNLVIVQDNTSQTLTVSNPNLIDVKSIKLYDIAGKQIFAKQSLGAQNSYEFSTSGLAGAVYLVEVVTNDNRKLAQKIIVSNQ
jgi:hypothetical protein